jgi:tRNA ligase
MLRRAALSASTHLAYGRSALRGGLINVISAKSRPSPRRPHHHDGRYYINHHLLPRLPRSNIHTMSADTAVHKHQNPAEINELLSILNTADRKKTKEVGFSCRKTSFQIEGTEHEIDSWKFPEQDFKKRDLPTFARGLFTWRDRVSGNHRIAVRGYDKFFNINEIYRTKWDWIEENTKAPYEVTVKENGCIIFISGLPDGTLLVCSKHSTGAREDADASHAVTGEKWVDKQLAQVGRTRRDLALALYNANATAVAELCDDSFEEHILEYKGDRAGLYLHGINLNLKDFATYSMEEVHKFADEWAFRKIDYLLKDKVKGLREFLEEAAETGSWDGKDVEGFVIRCKARNGPNDPEWHDWFFKFKFEEPYLMYRQWREVTKAHIAGKQPKYKKHEQITKEYLEFARRYFSQNKGASQAYQKNHGIIKLRNAFLEHRGQTGADIIKQETVEGIDTNIKLVLVPIATIGCGKTTLAHALTKLFCWGHQQNDNFTMKRGKGQAFANACVKDLVNTPVVIADRNNHQKRERQQLFDDIVVKDARFVALHYVHYNGIDDKGLQQRIRQATRSRVFARGDNHQTIQAASKDRAEVEGIMEGFISRFQPVQVGSKTDSQFDHVIDLDPTKDSRENLETVVSELHKTYPTVVPEMPTAAALDEAIKAAFEEYKPAIKHEIKASNQQRKGSEKNGSPVKKEVIEYFSISLAHDDIINAIESALTTAPEEKRAFYNQLKESKRIQPKFHITLFHKSAKQQNLSLWEKYEKIYRENKPEDPMGKTKIMLENLVWDGRVMAITARILDPEWVCTNEFPHVTIGTANSSIKPKEANDMLVGKWNMGAGAEQVGIPGGIELYGTVKAIKINGGRP